MTNGTLLAWHADGSKVIANTDSISIPDVKGTLQSFPIATFSDGQANSNGSALFDFNDDGADKSEYVDQRFRLQTTYKANDQVKAVLRTDFAEYENQN